MESLQGIGVIVLWYVILAPAGVIFLAWLASHRHHTWWSEIKNHPRFYAGQALVWLPSLLILLGFMLAETIRKFKRRVPEMIRKVRARVLQIVRKTRGRIRKMVRQARELLYVRRRR